MGSSILLYTSPGCPDCAAVKNYLKQRQLDFEERDISAPGMADEAKSRYGVRIAPITVIDGEVLYGTFATQRGRLDALLPG